VADPNLTERQQKWFASVQASLERQTGRSLSEWVAIARGCPETRQRAQLRWLKDNYGLLQNHGMQVLHAAFPPEIDWRDPEKLAAALWSDPASHAIFAAIDRAARAQGDVIQTARKSYTAWSRKVQFAAARPLKGGKAMLGLAVSPAASPRLEAPRNESWSERLKARTLIGAPGEVDAEIASLMKSAWSNA